MQGNWRIVESNQLVLYASLGALTSEASPSRVVLTPLLKYDFVIPSSRSQTLKESALLLVLVRLLP